MFSYKLLSTQTTRCCPHAVPRQFISIMCRFAIVPEGWELISVGERHSTTHHLLSANLLRSLLLPPLPSASTTGGVRNQLIARHWLPSFSHPIRNCKKTWYNLVLRCTVGHRHGCDDVVAASAAAGDDGQLQSRMQSQRYQHLCHLNFAQLTVHVYYICSQQRSQLNTSTKLGRKWWVARA